MEPTIESAREERWVLALYATLTLLSLIPFWMVHYLPTVDGPCHTYNSWVLLHHGDPLYPLLGEYYKINAEPYPNWIGHAVMALLMLAVPPLVAEKILVSAYALTFLAGAWYLAGSVRPGNRWLALLALPFVFNFLFQFGFYNFSISLGLFLFIVGFWWRYRDRPGSPVYMVGINLLLTLCYFSHILSFGLALVAIAVLWLATLRRESWRRHLLHVPVLAPQGLLPAWYFTRQGGDSIASYWHVSRLVSYFVSLRVLSPFGGSQDWVATLLALIFLGLLVLTLRREGLTPWRREHAFLLLAVFFTLLYFVSPEGLSGGSMLKNRLSLYPWLLLIPWLAPALSPRARRIAAALLALVALLNLAFVIRWYGRLSGDMAGYLSGLATVEPGSRVLPVRFAHRPHGSRLDILGHAMGYAALEKGLIDWDNYEAVLPYFPLQLADTVPWPPVQDIEARPGHLRVRQWRNRADYIYTWRMRPQQPLQGRLERFYRPVAETNGGVLWKRLP
ncbi:MAG TPA: hypothetical protein VFR03_00265 [Thermoanaerobaculia bacterium]|nr:hypothetical protein [Thermoanaerobaculia bacterium]